MSPRADGSIDFFCCEVLSVVARDHYESDGRKRNDMYQKSFVVLPIQFQGQLDIHTPPIGGINKTSGIVLSSNTTVILRKDRGSSETAGFGRDEGSSCRIASRRHRAFIKMLSGGYVRSLDQKTARRHHAKRCLLASKNNSLRDPQYRFQYIQTGP